MTRWLALSLGLWLGQAPEPSSPLPPDVEVQDPAAIELREAWERALQSVDTTEDTQAPRSPGAPQDDVAQLRAELQELQAQVNSLQQQLSGMREEAADLERMRQQRLEEIARAGGWLVAADQALEVGELDIGDALLEADTALEQVVRSATDAGSGRTVLLAEGARASIAQALEATGRRDSAQARWWLFDAAERLREARRHNLDEPSATTITR